MRLIFGRGMISDDTEHTLMVAQALLCHSNDPIAFQRALGWKLRWWFASLPAGVGLATARACLRLWLGFPANKAAVESAGSGPAMRSAILGAFFDDEPGKRREFVLASSRLTHRSWQSDAAALAVAEAAALASKMGGTPEIERILSSLRELSTEGEWQTRLSDIEVCLNAGDSVADFVRRLGLERGVTGYSLYVVPVAIYAWLRHAGDFRAALTAAMECGGDTDTVGAILGALLGVSLGTNAIPQEWRNGLVEWPRSNRFILRVAQRLAEQKLAQQPLKPVPYFWPGQILRNLVFLVIVLVHGIRRVFPPY